MKKKKIVKPKIEEKEELIEVIETVKDDIISTDLKESEQLQKQGYHVIEIININGKTIHKLKRVN